MTAKGPSIERLDHDLADALVEGLRLARVDVTPDQVRTVAVHLGIVLQRWSEWESAEGVICLEPPD